MKHHITLPLVLIIAAVIIGAATIAVNRSAPANSSVATEAIGPDAVIHTVAITSDNTATAGQSGTRVITWQSDNFPTSARLGINLLKKVSDQPASYTFVRAIAVNTANDGTESWTPAASETGDQYYIEVVCGPITLQSGCRSSAPVKAF
jgi:hypothetical protein